MTPTAELAPLASALKENGLERFLAELGRHRLLSAAEEVTLARRVERGDAAAKAEMIKEAREAGKATPERLAEIEAEGKPTILPTWQRFYATWVEKTTPDPDPNPNIHGRVQLWEDMKATFWRLFVGLGLGC